MTGQDYRRALVGRWRWLVGGLLVGLLVGSAAALFLPGQYRSQTTVLFDSPLASADAAQTYQADVLARERAGYYVPLMVQDRLTQAVADRVGGALTARDVSRRLVAATAPDTPLLLITVTDSSPARSQQIAAASADSLVGLVGEIESPPVAEGEPPATPQVVASVVQPATFSTIPISASKAVYIALGALLGLVVGAVIALVREARDHSVRTVDELRGLTGKPVLATVPVVRRRPDEAAPLTTPEQDEAARRVRAVLDRVGPAEPPRVIALAGVHGNEDVAVVAALLARSIARAGRKVAVVGADLRHPAVEETLGVVGTAGLADHLRGRVGLSTVVIVADGVTVLPAGGTPEDAAELLASPRFAAALDELAGGHHTVLVVLPPVLPFAEAGVAAARATGTVLVARASVTDGADVTEALEQLDVLGAETIGTVLTWGVKSPPPATSREEHPAAPPAKPSATAAADTNDAADPDDTDHTTEDEPEPAQAGAPRHNPVT